MTESADAALQNQPIGILNPQVVVWLKDLEAFIQFGKEVNRRSHRFRHAAGEMCRITRYIETYLMNGGPIAPSQIAQGVTLFDAAIHFIGARTKDPQLVDFRENIQIRRDYLKSIRPT